LDRDLTTLDFALDDFAGGFCSDECELCGSMLTVTPATHQRLHPKQLTYSNICAAESRINLS
jgi:hypothetical protein